MKDLLNKKKLEAFIETSLVLTRIKKVSAADKCILPATIFHLIFFSIVSGQEDCRNL